MPTVLVWGGGAIGVVVGTHVVHSLWVPRIELMPNILEDCINIACKMLNLHRWYPEATCADRLVATPTSTFVPGPW